MDIAGLGRWLILVGGVLLGMGVVFILAGRFPFVGRLPGDVLVQRDGFTFYFPVTTLILLSVVLTLVLNLLLRFWGR